MMSSCSFPSSSIMLPLSTLSVGFPTIVAGELPLAPPLISAATPSWLAIPESLRRLVLFSSIVPLSPSVPSGGSLLHRLVEPGVSVSLVAIFLRLFSPIFGGFVAASYHGNPQRRTMVFRIVFVSITCVQKDVSCETPVLEGAQNAFCKY